MTFKATVKKQSSKKFWKTLNFCAQNKSNDVENSLYQPLVALEYSIMYLISQKQFYLLAWILEKCFLYSFLHCYSKYQILCGKIRWSLQHSLKENKNTANFTKSLRCYVAFIQNKMFWKISFFERIRSCLRIPRAFS